MPGLIVAWKIQYDPIRASDTWLCIEEQSTPDSWFHSAVPRPKMTTLPSDEDGNLVQGGIATFSNPLQGAICGPMALSVLSVLYNLHMSSCLPQPSGSRLSTPFGSGRIRS